MSLTYQANGDLEPGVYSLTMEEFELEFGTNYRRKELIKGLKLGMQHLHDCGCEELFVDGSFVTKKEMPDDFDACWDHKNMDLNRLRNYYPELLDFRHPRKAQKDKYKGEFFPAYLGKADGVVDYFHFFQKNKYTDEPKGIVSLKLK